VGDVKDPAECIEMLENEEKLAFCCLDASENYDTTEGKICLIADTERCGDGRYSRDGCAEACVEPMGCCCINGETSWKKKSECVGSDGFARFSARKECANVDSPCCPPEFTGQECTTRKCWLDSDGETCGPGGKCEQGGCTCEDDRVFRDGLCRDRDTGTDEEEEECEKYSYVVIAFIGTDDSSFPIDLVKSLLEGLLIRRNIPFRKLIFDDAEQGDENMEEVAVVAVGIRICGDSPEKIRRIVNIILESVGVRTGEQQSDEDREASDELQADWELNNLIPSSAEEVDSQSQAPEDESSSASSLSNVFSVLAQNIF